MITIPSWIILGGIFKGAEMRTSGEFWRAVSLGEFKLHRHECRLSASVTVGFRANHGVSQSLCHIAVTKLMMQRFKCWEIIYFLKNHPKKQEASIIMKDWKIECLYFGRLYSITKSYLLKLLFILSLKIVINWKNIRI